MKDESDVLQAALRAVDWEKTRMVVTRYCWLATKKRSWADAEDVAQEAIAQLLDPAYVRWDPKKEPLVTKQLANIARGILSNRRRTMSSREAPTEDEQVEALLPDVADGEAAVANRAFARDVVERVRASTASDAGAQESLALYAEGVESLDDHATAIGRPKHEAKNARRRLQAHAEAARRELGGDDS